MTNVRMVRGTTAQILNAPIVDGQLLFTTDGSRIYMDNGTDRHKLHAIGATNCDAGQLYVVDSNRKEVGISYYDDMLTYGTKKRVNLYFRAKDHASYPSQFGFYVTDENGNNVTNSSWSFKIQDYLPLASGGTVTGNIFLKDSVINRDGDPPTTSSQTGKTLSFLDKDGERIGVLRADRDTDNAVTLRIASVAEVDGSENGNWITLKAFSDDVNKDYVGISETLILSKNKDASGIADNRPALIVGGTQTAAHIEIDSNEILAKANGNSTAVLNLNTDGGNVNMGGSLGTHGYIQANDGNIFSKKSSMDISAASVSANQYTTIGAQDANGRYAGFMSINQYTDGHTATVIAARRYNSSANADNSITLTVDKSGNRTVSVSHPTLWRSAIGAVSKSGDHVTGNIQMDASHFYMDSDNITTGTIPKNSSNVAENRNGNASITFRDSAENNVSFIHPRFLSDGKVGAEFVATRIINGSYYYNSLWLGLDASGNRFVTVTNPESWRTAIGAAASSHTHSYLPLAGGTMTGQIKMSGTGAMPHATGTGWYPIVMDSFDEGGGLRYMNTSDLLSLLDLTTRQYSGTGAVTATGSTLSVARLFTNNIMSTVYYEFKLKANLANSAEVAVGTVARTDSRPSFDIRGVVNANDVQIRLDSSGIMHLWNGRGSVISTTEVIKVSFTYMHT